MDDFKTIGARIRRVRVERKMTQVDLASAIGVSRSHLTNAERGKGGLALDKLSALAKETGTSVAWLIGEDASADQARTLLTIFEALGRQDRDTLIRIAQGLLREENPKPPPTKPTKQEKPKRPRPFVVGGRVKENRVEECPTKVVPLRAVVPT